MREPPGTAQQGLQWPVGELGQRLLRHHRGNEAEAEAQQAEHGHGRGRGQKRDHTQGPPERRLPDRRCHVYPSGWVPLWMEASRLGMSLSLTRSQSSAAGGAVPVGAIIGRGDKENLE